MDLFYLLKENFKNLLFDWLITGRSFNNLSCLSSCSSSQRWKFRRICSNNLWGIESDLAYTKVLGVVSQYILWCLSLWYPLNSSMFSSSKHNLRSLRRVAISSSLLNFGMFSHSTILISWFSHFISKTGGFG